MGFAQGLFLNACLKSVRAIVDYQTCSTSAIQDRHNRPSCFQQDERLLGQTTILLRDIPRFQKQWFGPSDTLPI